MEIYYVIKEIKLKFSFIYWCKISPMHKMKLSPCLDSEK